MVQVFRQYVSFRKMIFVIGEGVLIILAVFIASYSFFREEIGVVDMLEMIWPKVLLISIVAQVSLYFNDLYQFKAADSAVDLASRLVQSIGITSITLALFYFLWPDLIIGRWIFFASLILLLSFLVAWRLLYAVVIRRKFLAEKSLLLGSGELASDIWRETTRRRDLSYNIASVVTHGKNESDDGHFQGVDVYHGFNQICDLVESIRLKSIIVALDEKRGIFPYKELLKCKMRGINIIDGQSFYERITGKLMVEKISPSWLILSDGFVKSKTARISKRLIGLTLSVGMLISFAPIMLLVAVAIKLDSRGPVFFSQKRVGAFGKVFTLYKFRSMCLDAETSGPMWATEHDPRITRIGKIIRRLRIDEWPQLWNVVKGDMSFVGPRPERPFFVDELKKTIPYYDERFSVKPGVTGWAQIKYPYGSSEQDALEKLKYDLYYIKNMSIVLDLIVIFHTVKTVLLSRGAR